ncbi:ubx domain-containing protein 4 [Limosa lapponica baueri]|uniref:Ubx domain-containing protein 4 n=1 Tax=Limosa lapponica baueri TaxID=1758121 RepID=A0A2I0TA37_LIMLA|nr:ubx domain-containing protein 4 [Limosa lapponica baueri]
MEVHGGADIYLQPMEDLTSEQVDAPEGGCDPVGSPCWSRFLAGPAACGGPTLEHSVPEGLHPMEMTHTGTVCEELQHMGRTFVGGVCGQLSPMGGTPYWSRGRA